MIIAIGGKIASGKNNVCEIIQDLCKKHKGPSFEQKAFAGKLKTIASLLTGIPVESFEDQEFKKALLGPEWGTVRTNPLNAIPVFGDVKFLHMMSVREFLQKLGTEAMRDGLHKNVWVNALFADYTKRIVHYPLTEEQIEYNNKQTGPVPSVNEKLDYPNWVITDMRFPNEMDAVEERKGITIRVVRYPETIEQSRGPKNVETILFDPTNQKHMDLWKANCLRMHPSETALDDAKFDYEIINDGTMEKLVHKVREILIKENII